MRRDNVLISTIEKTVAERSLLIKNMLDDLGPNAEGQTIPIPNVSHPCP